jgi:hypothetical protein
MTKFAVTLFAALALTFAGASALQAKPGPPGPPSYVKCLTCRGETRPAQRPLPVPVPGFQSVPNPTLGPAERPHPMPMPSTGGRLVSGGGAIPLPIPVPGTGHAPPGAGSSL